MGPPFSRSLPSRNGWSMELLGSTVSHKTDKTVCGLGSRGRKDNTWKNHLFKMPRVGLFMHPGRLGPLMLRPWLFFLPVQPSGGASQELSPQPQAVNPTLHYVSLLLYPHLGPLVRSKTPSQCPWHPWDLEACTDPHALPESWK